MKVKTWELPISATWHRATDLGSLHLDREGLTLMLNEQDSDRRWRLTFSEVQAFKWTTEESAATILGALPKTGAFYEVVGSNWLPELGQGKLDYMSRASHYIICCYDEVLEIAASAHAIEPA